MFVCLLIFLFILLNRNGFFLYDVYSLYTIERNILPNVHTINGVTIETLYLQQDNWSECEYSKNIRCPEMCDNTI